MPVRVEVKSTDPTLKGQRETAADHLVKQFGNRLPDSKLLCFFDDEDCQHLKARYGRSNRGSYVPLTPTNLRGIGDWPHSVRECILVWDSYLLRKRSVFDHLIYLHGSTCADETGLVMTFAHELQHFVQYCTQRKLWATSRLITNLHKDIVRDQGLKWADVPHEREARIVAKRVAETLSGEEAVRQYIDLRISEAAASQDRSDKADWEFIRDLDASIPYDLAEQTRVTFQSLKHLRPQFEEVLHDFKDDPDYDCIDLNTLLDDAGKLSEKKPVSLHKRHA